MPSPNSSHLPAELLVLVGKIALQSAYVDLMIGEFYGGLKDVREAQRARTIHVLDTRRKIQEAEQLVKTKFKGHEQASLLDLLKRAGDLLAQRNLVLHAIVGYRQMEQTDPIFLPFRGKYAGKNVPFTEETLNPIFNDLVATAKELAEQCQKRGYSEFSTSPEKQP